MFTSLEICILEFKMRLNKFSGVKTTYFQNLKQALILDFPKMKQKETHATIYKLSEFWEIVNL